MTAPYPSVPPSPQPTGPRVPWSVAESVATFLIAFGLGLVLIVPVVVLGSAIGVDQRDVNALGIPLTPIVLGATTLLVVGLRHRGAVPRLLGRRRPSPGDLLVGVAVAAVGYLGLNLALGSVLQLLFEAAGFDAPVVQETFRDAAAEPGTAWSLVIGAAMLAPVAEELLFRGMLFQALRDRLGVGWGVWLSAAAFAATHVDVGASWLSNVLLLAVIWPLGALLAWAFHRRGSLLVPVVGHALFNAVNVTFLVTLAAAGP